MTVSRGMRRLLRVLRLQEERCLAEMEAALADLKRLQGALIAAREQDRKGRRLVMNSVATGEVTDRLAGLEESRTAHGQTQALRPKASEAQVTANGRRGEYLSKRLERRQAETIVEKMEVAGAAEAGRHRQQELDEWFLGRLGHRD